MDLKPYLEGKFGLSLEKHGDEYAVPCPRCDGDRKKEWRLWFNVKSNIGTCYKCHRGGNATWLVMELEGMNRLEAMFFMKENIGLGQGVSLSVLKQRVEKALSDEDEEEEKKLVAVDLPYEFRACADFPKKKWPKYLRERISDDKAIETHNIGWCSQGYFRDRLIVPVYFKRKVFTFVARDMTGRASKKVVYPSGSQTGRLLFNYDVAKKFPHVVLVESVLDAIHVGPNAMALFGTSLSRYQLALLLNSKAREVSTMFDGDDAGYKGARAVMKQLAPFYYATSLRRVDLDEGKDPDDYPRREIDALLERAASSGDLASIMRGALRRL